MPTPRKSPGPSSSKSSKSSPSQQTLLQFFQKRAPPSSPIKKPEEPPMFSSDVTAPESVPNMFSDSSMVDDDTTIVSESDQQEGTRKRKMTVLSDSEDEWSPETGAADLKSEDEKDEKEDQPPAEKHVPSSSNSSKLLKFSISSTYKPGPHVAKPKKVKVEQDPERYAWLLDVKDIDGNRPGDPDYDPRTLHVPKYAWAKFTPFEKQYWEVKHKLYNTVVFFKKGKFYELYENDAQIAHQVFDLKLAGGGRANMSLCGVPEMSFDYWASAFIAKGYKVARVDQAETALGKEMRDQAQKKKEEKIIRRELSCVLTGGTLTDSAMLVGDLSQYCLSITQHGLEFAACFVDTSTGQFYVSHFTDKSSDYPLLETLIAQTRPKELIIPRGKLERYALKIIKNNTSSDTLWEIVKPDTEFWDADTARREIDLNRYFHTKNEDQGDESSAPEPPQALIRGLENDLSASAIGGLIYYLRSLKLDVQLLSLGQFNEYNTTSTTKGATMILDGQTLQNLEVFANTWDGSSEGTLFKLVNKCVTPFGKRRLRSWIAHPLQEIATIKARADAVDMFMEQDEVREMLLERLTGLPDAERMLSRVHAGSLRPKDFVKLVDGLDRCANILNWLDELRTRLPQIDPFLVTEHTSQLKDVIMPWMTAFDHVKAKENDKLVPEEGVDEEFDITLKAYVDTDVELQELLEEYKKLLKISLEYRDSGKEIYLIEVPIKAAKHVPDDWQQMGATAKCKRFYTPKLKQLVRQRQEAEELHNMAANDCRQKLYARFCSPQNYQIFTNALKVVAAIDCLLSLAQTSMRMAVHCRPEFVEHDTGFLDFKELRHPMATSTDFIPNDISLGKDTSRMSLLTGANAAGKSTVLRTTGCAVLLAQLGCHVPAREAQLTPVDRIMTRLGASDNIFAGKSTFHMELAETERILSEATSHSFVVIDELGRGGSSTDGFAIAESVLYHLATHINCLGFFATHYATLYDSFKIHPQVKPERMAIQVHSDTREVTFLYTLEPGRSEGSFGMNVALMCGIDAEIVENAEKAAENYEQTSKSAKLINDGDIPLGLRSDLEYMQNHEISDLAMKSIIAMVNAIDN